MPIIEKGDKDNWYNTIPKEDPKADTLIDPAFKDKMRGENEFKQKDGLTLAKIPHIPGRIVKRKEDGGHGSRIVFIADEYYDEERKENVREEVIIGEDASFAVPGMMAIDKRHYRRYFDRKGHLRNDPLAQRRAREAEEKANQEKEKQPAKESGMNHDPKERMLREKVREALAKKNAVHLGDEVFVRIPDIPGRIRTLEPNRHGTANVEYICERWYDAEKGQSRNRKAIIGSVSDQYPDAMVPNENYSTWFDIDTGLPKEEENGNQPDDQPNDNQPTTPPAEAVQTGDPDKTKEEEYRDRFEKAILDARKTIMERNRESQRALAREAFEKLYGKNSEDAREAAARRLAKIFHEAKQKESSNVVNLAATGYHLRVGPSQS